MISIALIHMVVAGPGLSGEKPCRTAPTWMLLCRTKMLVATPWELDEAVAFSK